MGYYLDWAYQDCDCLRSLYLSICLYIFLGPFSLSETVDNVTLDSWAQSRALFLMVLSPPATTCLLIQTFVKTSKQSTPELFVAKPFLAKLIGHTKPKPLQWQFCQRIIFCSTMSLQRSMQQIYILLREAGGLGQSMEARSRRSCYPILIWIRYVNR